MGTSQPSSGATSKRHEKATEKRLVAGSFLFKIPDNDAKKARVALFRRSSKVRTYQHKLAPLSGSVEASDVNPLATAIREIQEETTLTTSSIELLRVGKPYSFVDDSIGREWSINPFAFRLKDVKEGGEGEQGIVLDWEHDGIEWFDPLEINESDKFGGVPKLVNSLRRVWPEYDLGAAAARILTDRLQTLRDDHQSEARQVAAAALTALRAVIEHMDSSQSIDELWWARVRMAAWHLCKARKSMDAAIANVIVKALDRLEMIVRDHTNSTDKVSQMMKAIDNQLDDGNNITDRICNSFVEYLRHNVLLGTSTRRTVSILTLSNSSSISQCVRNSAALLGIQLDLRILESRPLCEGVTPASELLDNAKDNSLLKVTLFSDASSATAAQDIDLVVLGADQINSSGDVSSRAGSLPAILSAKHIAPDSKVVILSETEKICGPGHVNDHLMEHNSLEELLQTWTGAVSSAEAVDDARRNNDDSAERKVKVKNTYFEWIPTRLIDAYVTEEGSLTPEKITERSSWFFKETNRFFDGL
ncbi:nagb/rpia/CoA transferase-like protein [Xylariaceae sp. FL0016]|nr:nagb/rpia/CoA transferase-like protein [Xylariaceae sp. FL0016]